MYFVIIILLIKSIFIFQRLLTQVAVMSLSKREYEDYKAAVEKMVYKYVTRDRSSIVSAITHAVDSGCDKRKVEDKLMGYVDKSLAYKLAEKVRK